MLFTRAFCYAHDENLLKGPTWIEIDAEKQIFTCWIYEKYPGVANKENKVTEGCIGSIL